MLAFTYDPLANLAQLNSTKSQNFNMERYQCSDCFFSQLFSFGQIQLMDLWSPRGGSEIH
jgi:hypothetical protein